MQKKLIDVVCPQCDRGQADVWVSGGVYPCCPCGAVTVRQFNHAAAKVVSDEIVGGVDVRHGLCHSDGSPRRFYSHSELRKAAAAKGLVNLVERGIADKKDYDRLTRRHC